MPMKAYDSFAEWKKDQSPRNIRLISALTKIVESAAPQLSRTVKWGQGCFANEGVPKVYLHAARDHVQLGFYRGSSLKDPKRLLSGNGQYVRAIRVHSASQIDPAAYARLVKQACHPR
jgi:hypothetical protein